MRRNASTYSRYFLVADYFNERQASNHAIIEL